MHSLYHDLVHMPLATLLDSAAALRQRTFDNKVSLCAIINARSGLCSMDCHFCAQSRHHHSNAPTFALLSQKQILQQLDILAPYPIKRVGIVTSGGALSDTDLDALIELFTQIAHSTRAERWHGRLCTSLGRLDTQGLEKLKKAGIERYHHNLESSEHFYPHICTTQSWQQRQDTVTRVQNTPMSVCCGGIFGLGESWENRISLALSLKAMRVTHVPINFLHPQKGTPLERQKLLTAHDALRIIAIFRHILPQATLRVCGGAHLVLQEQRERIFHAGANALMVGDYLTTQGKAIDDDMRMLEKLGLRPDSPRMSC